jgi:hypothetical protein
MWMPYLILVYSINPLGSIFIIFESLEFGSHWMKRRKLKFCQWLWQSVWIDIDHYQIDECRTEDKIKIEN